MTRDDQKTDLAVLQYPDFLLKVVEEKIKQTEASLIEILPSVSIIESSTKLVEFLFPNFKEKYDFHTTEVRTLWYVIR